MTSVLNVSPEIIVNLDTAGAQTSPKVTTLADGTANIVDRLSNVEKLRAN